MGETSVFTDVMIDMGDFKNGKSVERSEKRFGYWSSARYWYWLLVLLETWEGVVLARLLYLESSKPQENKFLPTSILISDILQTVSHEVSRIDTMNA